MAIGDREGQVVTVEPTLEEAIAIVEAALSTATVGPKMTFADFDTMTQTQSVQGVLSIMRGAQLLGWRIARPLKGVP